MVVEKTIAHSKGLLGAFFLQYTIYSVLYVFEGCRYQKFRGLRAGAHDSKRGELQEVYELDVRDIVAHEKNVQRQKTLRQQRMGDSQSEPPSAAEVDQINLDVSDREGLRGNTLQVS